MKRVLLDTNIIIDIAKRSELFFEHSSKVFRLAVEEKIVAYVSASAVTDIFYILQKENGKADTILFLKELFNYIDILGVDKTIIMNALNSDWKDFEDAVQGSVSIENRLDFLVTRNTKDFTKLKGAKVLTPLDFLEEIYHLASK